jgi:hypothetical protein
MGALIPLTAAASPVERILSRFDRAQLEGFIAVAIDLLDVADGDNDLEDNGDELDGTAGEDDFHTQRANWKAQPGCPLADPGGCEHDGIEPDDDREADPAEAGVVPTYGVDQDNARE